MPVGDPGSHPRGRRVPLSRHDKAVDEGVCSIVPVGVLVGVLFLVDSGSGAGTDGRGSLAFAVVIVIVIVLLLGVSFARVLSLVLLSASERFPALDEGIHDIVDDGAYRFPARSRRI